MKRVSHTRGRRSIASYHSSLVKPKRSRRSFAEMDNVLAWINHFIAESDGEQMSVRHLFYLLVGANIIHKTEAAYTSLVSHLSKWRRCGQVEWSAFTDSTRWHIKTETFDSMNDALVNTAATYRRNLWSTQKVYVEMWCEKDAMAGTIARAAEPFGVPVFVARGFASLSSLYSAANTFRAAAAAGKRCVIHHFGDWDPSGVAACESIVRAFRDDFKVDVELVRAAVTAKQIKAMKLPTRPVKTSDSRAAKWTGGECVELDTMPPAEIRKLVESCITQHITDRRAWEVLKETEILERTTLKYIQEGGWLK